jgi:aspartyl-tRNA(Asn)/glutamyl-tRNA(Gln) amidotransferase subunit B
MRSTHDDGGDGAAEGWEVVLGLEVHCQLATRTKLFCGCANAFGAAPNTNVCPVCTAQPGALPVLNEAAVALAVRAALALDAEVAPQSRFDRKNYFYCDLPKGFQTSQYALPIARGGGLALSTGRAVSLRRIHIEEDAGKAIHDRGPRTLVDLNRAGVPLIEIVSEADLRSGAEAVEYLASLREVLQYAGISECDMEKGSLRCDVNVSVRRPGEPLRTKVELKNLNSFRNAALAIDHEVARQTALYEAGGRVAQETRLFDVASGATRLMRSKEDEHDYRYFPEPDLPAIVVDAAAIARERAAIPALPAARRRRYREELGLSEQDARVLTESRALSDYFERAAELADPKGVANWIANDLRSILSARAAPAAPAASARAPHASGDIAPPPEHLAELARLARSGALSTPAAREVLAAMVETGKTASVLVEERGLGQVSDPLAVEAWCRDALRGKEAVVAEVLAGKERALGALVGPVMKASGGRANPALVRETLLRLMRDGHAP